MRGTIDARAGRRILVCLSTLSLGVVAGCNAINGVDAIRIDAIASSAEPAGDDGQGSGNAQVPGGDPSNSGDPSNPLPDPDGQPTPGDEAGTPTGPGDDPDGGPIVDAGGADSATPPDPPANYRRVFVSSSGLKGNMGGLSGADNFCQTLANNAKLSGKWIAWLSTSQQEAIQRITFSGQYRRIDGAEVVANKDQLGSAALTNPINIDEYGHVFPTTPGNKDIWTGTSAAAGDSSGSSCNDWTSSGSLVMGTRGNAAVTTVPEWTQVPGFANGGWGCQVQLSMYCFEK